MELVPIGTILAVLTKQVIKTATAAKDILIEKESFKVLSKHLFDIESVLKELQLQELNDSQAARHALESLESDVKQANYLVEKYRNRSRFYLLVRCRHIVNEVQQITRKIGESLAALSLANNEVLLRISDQVTRIQNEMQRVEFHASHFQLQIVDKLTLGLQDQQMDQGFANNILEEIAKVVGVPVEPLEISKELTSLKKEKEEAECRKERAEALFLDQVIKVLSLADAARDYQEIMQQYFRRVRAIEHYEEKEKYIPPLNSFICQINGTVMVDPVSLCTNTTCERAAVQAWFESGKRTDPETGDFLEDISLRPNFQLRQSIEEWQELNYCLKIRSSEAKLLSGDERSVEEALKLIQDLMREKSINRDWITIGGITDLLVLILGSSHNKDLKRKILITLKNVVEGHARNKETLIETQGWDHIISSLGCNSGAEKAAVELIDELLHDTSGWNLSACRKLAKQCTAINLLVIVLKGPERESAGVAQRILMKLFDTDEVSISSAAMSGWYDPIIGQIVRGPESSALAMVKTLVNMDITDSNLKFLGEEGIVPPLLKMLSGNIESKELSLSALIKLSDVDSNKKLIAAAGGVPPILKLMFSSHMPSIIVVKCSQIFEKISSSKDAIRLFVDGDGIQLEMESIVAGLLDLTLTVAYNIRRPILRALLGILKSDSELVKKAVLNASDLLLVLPLLDDPDSVIREIAISLLFLFSQHEPERVVEYLLKPRRLEALVGLLENDKPEVQIASAGLLANLPKSERSLTIRLIELSGLDSIINILKSGTDEAKENALSALFRFTDPTNIEAQRMLVERGAYPLFVNCLSSGSSTAKARAAALIGDLSSSTPKLRKSGNSASCLCFKYRKSGLSYCIAHSGICRVNTTFCLVEANALPGLVNLLKEEVHATAFEAIRTLSTLMLTSPLSAALVLHDANAIIYTLNILNWGSDSLKVEALELLEKVFRSKDMVEFYGSRARPLLAEMSSRSVVRDDEQLPGKAVRVLALIERYSKSFLCVPA